MTLDDFTAVIDVHLRGTWLGTREPPARGCASSARRHREHLLDLRESRHRRSDQLLAAKAGIVGLTKAAAKELAHHGVRVNAIQPGLIRTAMTEAMPQHIWDQKVSEIPLDRVGEVGRSPRWRCSWPAICRPT